MSIRTASGVFAAVFGVVLGGPVAVRGDAIVFPDNTQAISTGDLTAIATDTASPGDDIVLNAGSSLQSTGGSVILRAGDDFLMDPTASIEAAVEIVMVVDFNDADPGIGGKAYVLGNLGAPKASVLGGPDADFFWIVPDDLTPIFVFGGDPTSSPGDELFYDGFGFLVFTGPGSGVISSPGFADVTFENIESVSLAATVPEPGSLALLASGLVLVPAAVRRRRRTLAA